MPVGFPAYYEQRVFYDCSTRELIEAIEDAFDMMRWNGYRVDRYRWTASTGWTFFSYGENITVELERDGEVHVRSEYCFPLAWIDWGHNSGNVRGFVARLDRIIGDRRVEDEDY
jgi:hypothetical protein